MTDERYRPVVSATISDAADRCQRGVAVDASALLEALTTGEWSTLTGASWTFTEAGVPKALGWVDALAEVQRASGGGALVSLFDAAWDRWEHQSAQPGGPVGPVVLVQIEPRAGLVWLLERRRADVAASLTRAVVASAMCAVTSEGAVPDGREQTALWVGRRIGASEETLLGDAGLAQAVGVVADMVIAARKAAGSIHDATPARERVRCMERCWEITNLTLDGRGREVLAWERAIAAVVAGLSKEEGQEYRRARAAAGSSREAAALDARVDALAALAGAL